MRMGQVICRLSLVPVVLQRAVAKSAPQPCSSSQLGLQHLQYMYVRICLGKTEQQLVWLRIYIAIWH